MSRLKTIRRYTPLLGGLILFTTAVLFIEDNIGLKTIPDDVPTTRGTAHPDYAAAIERASDMILAQRAEISSPAYSAAVAIDGEVVWSEAVGWANVEKRVPATPQTKFRIGSTSKAVTAAVTARLVDQGRIDIDVPISQYMYNLPEKWQGLTLRQLHSHTAGIVGYEENFDLGGFVDSYFLNRHFDDVVETLDAFDGARMLYKPGTGFHYSSYDVNLAAVILQSVAEEPFLDLLEKEVFAPLGLGSMAADDATQSIADRAEFYKRRGDRVEPWRPVDLSIKYPSGGLISTSSDLVRYGMAWLSGDYLSEEAVEAFWTPQRLASGEINEQSYAIGWRSTRAFSDKFQEDIWYVHHGGVSKGAMSWLIVFPEMQMSIALNTNARADSFADFVKPSRELAKLFYDARQAIGRNTSDLSADVIADTVTR